MTDDRLYPLQDFTATERAALAHWEATPAAPESYVRQHRSEPDCWCGPRQVGTLGVWTHNMGEEE